MSVTLTQVITLSTAILVAGTALCNLIEKYFSVSALSSKKTTIEFSTI